MAACLITVSGTSGTVRVDYLDGVTPGTVTSGIGTFYIEDTYTDVTYTTLSGDAIASSGCFTITALPFACYELRWTGLNAPDYMIDAVILGADTFTIPDVEFPRSNYNLPEAINNLNNESIKLVQLQITNVALAPYEDIYSYIFRVVGPEIPILRVRNADSSGYIYIHGEPSACSIVGYTDINLCVTEIAP